MPAAAGGLNFAPCGEVHPEHLMGGKKKPATGMTSCGLAPSPTSGCASIVKDGRLVMHAAVQNNTKGFTWPPPHPQLEVGMLVGAHKAMGPPKGLRFSKQPACSRRADALWLGWFWQPSACTLAPCRKPAGIPVRDVRPTILPAFSLRMADSPRVANYWRWLGGALLLALVLLAVLRSTAGTGLDSFTVDEPWYIVAGTTCARGGGYHLNPEHPPLVKLWVGAWMPDSFRLRAPKPLQEKAQEREWVEQTLFFHNDVHATQQRARLSLWAFHGVLLLVLGGLVWRAFGLAWALGELGFLAIEPTVGAHLPVVMTDLPLALTLTIAAIAAGMLAATWRWPWAVACGLSMGLALAAKHSALVGLGGLGLGLLLAAHAGWKAGGREVLRRHALLAGVALLAVALLWGSYGLRFHAGTDGSDAFNRPMAEKIDELRLPHWRAGIAFADRHHLLPRAYLWGLADTVRTGVGGAASACTSSGERCSKAIRRGSRGRRSWRPRCRSRCWSCCWRRCLC